MHLGFTSATVYQERNAHNLMRDFTDEVECYVGVKSIVAMLDNLCLTADATQNLLIIYEGLYKKGFVKAQELDLCRVWVSDLSSILS